MALSVPKVGRRRPEKRSHRVPSSTLARCASSRRVHPCEIRARSIASASTDHAPALFTTANGMHSLALRPQGTARCYAFRPFRPAGGVAFGGPLLGEPDRHFRAAVGSPLGGGLRADSPPDDSPVCAALRSANLRALRVARPSARTRCGLTVPRRSTGRLSEVAPHTVDATGTPAPTAISISSLHVIAVHRSSRDGTFQPRLGTYVNVPNVPKASQELPDQSGCSFEPDTRGRCMCIDGRLAKADRHDRQSLRPDLDRAVTSLMRSTGGIASGNRVARIDASLMPCNPRRGIALRSAGALPE